MGKRKLHTGVFYQCDWTGFPMKQVFCYMPSWSNCGKLLKKGSYCNWESVVAHAAHLLAREGITTAEYAKVMDHIEHVTGTVPTVAPHFSELAHTTGRMDVQTFHATCAAQESPVMGVKITPQGEIFELLLFPEDGRFNFAKYLHSPFNYPSAPSTFHSMRKKGACKMTERDLGVWYYATKELPHNATASNVFKMQLYGDVLLVQQSREACFMPRERYVSFSKNHFDDAFAKKRKRCAEPPSMTTEAYAAAKDEMQKVLNLYEQKVAEKAVVPKDVSKVQTKVPTSLAKKVKERVCQAVQIPSELL